MKIVQPEVYVLTPPTSQHANSIYKFLETIGRTCYKSEDKITDMSWIKFISNIKNRGHWAMLEHYIFIIELSEKFYFKLMDEMVMFMADDAVFSNYIGYIKFSRIQMEPKDDSHSAKFIVSFSATCINNLWKCDSIKNNPKCAFAGLFVRMKTLYPDIILAPDYIENSGSFGGEYLPLHWENGNFPAKVIDIPDLAKYVHDDASINAYMLHSWMTVRLIVDRGITHELVRHRACSFAQESTRYVNYSDGKYGSEISVIEPCFFEKGSYEYEQWMLGCQEAEAAYNVLTDAGCKAQEARSVLPNSTKAEIVITARLNEWKHLFGLRCDKPAHPQMRQVAIPLMKAMKQVEGLILNENIVEKMFGGIPE